MTRDAPIKAYTTARNKATAIGTRHMRRARDGRVNCSAGGVSIRDRQFSRRAHNRIRLLFNNNGGGLAAPAAARPTEPVGILGPGPSVGNSRAATWD